MRRKLLQTAKLSNMLHLIRRIPSGTVELLTLLLLMPLLHNATATPGELATTIHIQRIVCECVFPTLCSIGLLVILFVHINSVLARSKNKFNSCMALAPTAKTFTFFLPFHCSCGHYPPSARYFNGTRKWHCSSGV